MSEELKVIYIENQYLRFEESIDEILKKMKKADYYVYSKKSISELDFSEIGEPNVLICVNVKDFENIYYSVKIIITNKKTLKEKWYEIPETIEYVICKVKYDYEVFRNNKNKFDYLEILTRYSIKNEKSIEIINELIEEGIRDEVNIVGKTILYYMWDVCMYDKMYEMIEKEEFTDKTYNKIIKCKEFSYCIITYICNTLTDNDDDIKNIIRLTKIISDKMSTETLNYKDGKYSVFKSLVGLKNLEIIMYVLPKITDLEILARCLISPYIQPSETIPEDETEEELKKRTTENERREIIQEAIIARIVEMS